MLRLDMTRQGAGLGECSTAHRATISLRFVDGLDVDLQSLFCLETSSTLVTLVGLGLTVGVGGDVSVGVGVWVVVERILQTFVFRPEVSSHAGIPSKPRTALRTLETLLLSLAGLEISA